MDSEKDGVYVNTKYTILMCKRLSTELQFLDKRNQPLDPDSNEAVKESLVQVRNCINKLDELFKDFNF